MQLLDDQPILKMDKMTMRTYLVALILSIGILVIGIIVGAVDKIIIAIPIIIFLIATIFYDKTIIHIPPLFIAIVVVGMCLNLLSRILVGNDEEYATVASIFTGFILGTIGLVLAYISLGKRPGTNKEKTNLIALEAFATGVALYSLWTLIIYAYMMLSGTTIEMRNVQIVMARTLFNAIGAALVSIIYYLGFGKGYFDNVIVKFLDRNSRTMGIDVDKKEQVRNIIKEGESSQLEFKSTLRMNLKTGEKDERMEKAVLKTIAAFLNSSGGTLLVGVADNGDILGADIELFENCDKMNLHITHLISAQLGDEFLPFIHFDNIVFGQKESGVDKVVIKFDCRPTSSPVFYKDAKEKRDIFFVRSGPSTIELNGLDLIKYVDNRKKKKNIFRRKREAAMMPQ